jgi:lactate dehydrogenase-like 2-hydroxyacid dehydrogenase
VNLPPEFRSELERHADVSEPGAPVDLERVEVLICGPIRPKELDQMKRLRFIQCVYAGVDGLPWSHVRDDVSVASNAGSNADAVAEHAFALLLAAAKRVAFFDSRMRSSVFELEGESKMLYGRRIAVLGMGAIGRRTAEIAKAYKMRVVGYARARRGDENVDELYLEGELDRALRAADYGVIALPLNKHTRGLITYDMLSQMSRTGILVNIGRAQIVVKEDLIRFLRENPAFIYATDVWWNQQEMQRDMDLVTMPNVVSTPWVAGAASSREVYEEMLKAAVENVLRYLRGERVLNIVRHEDYK